MIRWFRSVAAILRRLLWPMRKDLEPDVVRVVYDPAAGESTTVVSQAGRMFWMIDGAQVEITASEFTVGEDEPETQPEAAPEALPPKPRDGRQQLAMPATGSPLDALFGRGQAWTPRRDFRCAPWESLHTFPGARPRRDDFGLHGMTDPLSMICPACELEQPPLTQGERGCPYCGLRLRISGTYVLWWRASIEPALQWPSQTDGSGR